jgi:predicted metalloprotease
VYCWFGVADQAAFANEFAPTRHAHFSVCDLLARTVVVAVYAWKTVMVCNNAQKRLNWLEPGDIEEALNAANAIGDDR